jgi:uncharacterized coiled-coil protein SlyX
MASEIVTDLRKPIDSDAIYDWIVEKRKTSTSDFPRLGFANEMGLIDEQRTTAADRITELEAESLAHKMHIAALSGNCLAKRDRITQQDAMIAGLVETLEKVLPIGVEDGPDYALVYFGGDGNHSSQAMTMNPQHWLDIAAALAKAKESRDA